MQRLKRRKRGGDNSKCGLWCGLRLETLPVDCLKLTLGTYYLTLLGIATSPPTTPGFLNFLSLTAAKSKQRE